MKNAGKEGSESTVPNKRASQGTRTPERNPSKPTKQAAGKAGAGQAAKTDVVPQQTPPRRRARDNAKNGGKRSVDKKSKRNGGQTARKKARSQQGGTEKGSRAEQVQELLQTLKEKLKEDTIKPSIADYIRLVQLENQLVEEDAPTEIKVTWIDPATDESASGQ
jgi:hypothetical protein